MDWRPLVLAADKASRSFVSGFKMTIGRRTHLAIGVERASQIAMKKARLFALAFSMGAAVVGIFIENPNSRSGESGSFGFIPE